MFNPPGASTGKSILVFAAIMLGVGLWTGLGRQAWADATLWIAIAVFLACYGAISADLLPQFRRALLAAGLLAGGLAFGLALRTMLGGA
jgi:hypothetical protein